VDYGNTKQIVFILYIYFIMLLIPYYVCIMTLSCSFVIKLELMESNLLDQVIKLVNWIHCSCQIKVIELVNWIHRSCWIKVIELVKLYLLNWSHQTCQIKFIVLVKSKSSNLSNCTCWIEVMEDVEWKSSNLWMKLIELVESLWFVDVVIKLNLSNCQLFHVAFVICCLLFVESCCCLFLL